MEPNTKPPINEGLLPEVSEEEQVEQAIRRSSNEYPGHLGATSRALHSLP